MLASIRFGFSRRSRAMALLNTTTTQKVAWPMTMVQNENGMCSVP